MPTKEECSKGSPVFEVLYPSGDYVIEKANCMALMEKDYFTLEELKMFDVYLSLINPRNIEKTDVVITKSQLEKIVGKGCIKPNVLEQRINNLMKPITIRNPDKNPDIPWVKISLFEMSMLRKNSKGEYEIFMRCSSTSRRYIFGIDNIGYMKYQLKNVTSLSSKKTYYFYLYLQKERVHHSTWTVNLEQLYEVLHLGSTYYGQYHRFSDKILGNIIKEVNEKTDLAVSFKRVISNKNNTTALTFFVSEKKSLDNQERKYVEDENKRFRDANKDRIKEISTMLAIKESDAFNILKEATKFSLSYELIKERIEYVKSRDNINNVVGYTITIMNPDKWSSAKKQMKGVATSNGHFENEHSNMDIVLEKYAQMSMLDYLPTAHS